METRIVRAFVKISQAVRASRLEEHPFRYLLCRTLVRSRLCSRLVIRRKGYRLRFHPTNISVSMWMQGLSCYDWEERFIQSLLRVGDTFVDVGANIGNLTIAGKLKVQDGTVVAIEAHPRTYSFLVDNINLNQLKIDARNLAVGDKSGVQSFSDMHADDCNGISTTGIGLPVKVGTLDQELRTFSEIRLLKVDIEGYELMAFLGARGVLTRTKFVYFELGDSMTARYGYKPADVIQLLNDSGFRVFRVFDSGTLVKISSVGNFSQVENYLAEKVEKQNFII